MIIIDVRTPEEYAHGHVGSAMNIPLDQIAQGSVPPVGLDEKIVLYCRSGGRAEQAKIYLEAAGYQNVTNAGGMSDMTKS